MPGIPSWAENSRAIRRSLALGPCVSRRSSEVEDDYNDDPSIPEHKRHRRPPSLSQAPRPGVLRRKLELVRFSFMTIGDIDCAKQSFRAQVHFEMRFPGGGHDEDLNADGDKIPPPRHGQPPRPPGTLPPIELGRPGNATGGGSFAPCRYLHCRCPRDCQGRVLDRSCPQRGGS